MRESKFQKTVMDDIERLLPGAIIIKVEPYIQGFPDLIIIYGKNWAALETKSSEKASRRPNQPYWIDILSDMSFAAFVYPKNKEEVLHELQQTFTRDSTRIPVGE